MSLLDFIDLTNPEKCKLPGCKRGAGVYRVALLVVMFIFIYYMFMLVGFNCDADIIANDPMNYKLFKLPGMNHCFSAWPLTHFILFFIMGLLFPENDLLVMGGGIVWEIIEDTFFHCAGRKEVPIRSMKTREVQYSASWWAGSIQDVIVNALGYYLGKFIIKISGKKICFPWLNGETKWCGTEYCEDKDCVYCMSDPRDMHDEKDTSENL